MQAIILAGGLGTRLQPTIGSDIPKSMADIGGRPFLAQYVEQLAAQGVTHATLAVCHQAGVIQDYFGHHYKGIDVEYSVEQTPLGTGGAIKQALGQLNTDKSVFVSNADSIMDLDIQKMLASHQRANATLSVAVKHSDDVVGKGVVECGANMRITAFAYPAKAPSGWMSLGAYIMEPNVFDGADLPEAFSFEKDFKAKHIDGLEAYAYPYEGQFLDFGTQETYRLANS